MKNMFFILFLSLLMYLMQNIFSFLVSHGQSDQSYAGIIENCNECKDMSSFFKKNPSTIFIKSHPGTPRVSWADVGRRDGVTRWVYRIMHSSINA